MKYDEDKKEYILHTHPEIHRWGVPNPICPGSFLPDWQVAQHNIDITPENIIEDEYYNLRNTGPKYNPEGKVRCFSDKKVEKIRQERDNFKNKFIRCEADTLMETVLVPYQTHH